MKMDLLLKAIQMMVYSVNYDHNAELCHWKSGAKIRRTILGSYGFSDKCLVLVTITLGCGKRKEGMILRTR